jgi:hypothetical protein
MISEIKLFNIIANLLKAFLCNGLVNTFQHATVADVSKWINVIAFC